MTSVLHGTMLVIRANDDWCNMYEIILNGFNINGLVSWVIDSKIKGVSYGLRTQNNTHTIKPSAYTVRAKGVEPSLIEPYLKVNNIPAAGLVVDFLTKNARDR